jgi:mannobiose 2-epimerase
MTARKLFTLLFAAMIGCQSPEPRRTEIATAMEKSLREETLSKWYPLCIDTIYGGYLSSFTYDFKPTADQRKMIVTQARHTWTNARAAHRYPDIQHYKTGAAHGFNFLRDVMWDKQFGGFFTLVSRDGVVDDVNSQKTAYGNAFGIYALAAYYDQSGDTSALALVKSAFNWLEAHSHDGEEGGYFQHLARDGSPVQRSGVTESTSDLGYKDQNSSIHLLEAFTELYQVWPDTLVRTRLEEMLLLIRDRIVTPEGYLTLFLTHDFTPISFRDSSREVISRHHYLDHVSFGHDVETAYLLLEASHVLGWENDTTTMRVTKRMMDHALMNGWDDRDGGFFDEGYYFKDSAGITITYDTKNWWAQAEGLNALLMMADLYPDDPMDYYGKFEKLWRYVDTNLIDHENGDWFAGGIDKQPELKTALKGHIWKAVYHHYRSLTNCIDRLNRGHAAGTKH